MADSRRGWTILGLLAAFLCGVCLRFAGIAKLSFWYDEGFTAWVVSHTPGEIVAIIRHDTAPPLYYLFLHGWMIWFGSSEAALRSMSAVLGVVTIALVAEIARLTLKKPAAIVAATWLFVLSFMQIWYSQEARNYELAAFWMGLMLVALLHHLQRPSWKWLALLIISVIGAAYTHNIMMLYIGAVGAAGLVFPSPMPMWRRVRDMLIVVSVLIASLLPWLGPLVGQVRSVNAGFWIEPPTFDSVCALFARICGVAHYYAWDRFIHVLYRNTQTGVCHTTVAILAIGILLAVVRLRGDNRRTAIALAIATLGAPLAAVLDSLINRPILLPAIALPSTVVFPVLAAGALAWTTAPRSQKFAKVFVAFTLIVTVANLCGYEAERDKEDWRQAARIVAAMQPVTSRLIIFPDQSSRYAFDYYYQRRSGETERWISASDLDDLQKTIIAGDVSDIVLVNSHAGWIDEAGQVRSTYSDPGALVTKFVLNTGGRQERFDLPAAGQHAITIYHSRLN